MVNDPSTIEVAGSRHFPVSGTAVEYIPATSAGVRLEELFYIANRSSFDQATELFGQMGMMAIDEAAARSQRYRELGNAIRFCEWRQIERFLALLSQELPVGTVH